MKEIIKIGGQELEIDADKRVLLTSALNYVRDRIAKESGLAKYLINKDFDGFLTEVNDPGYEYIKLAAKIIFMEYEVQKQNPGMYLVDSQSGLSLGTITEEKIFHPQEWTDENGVVHKPGPIVHPGITSSLGLQRYEDTKKDETINLIQEQIKENPYKKHTFNHLINPHSILEYAIHEFFDHGIQEFQGPHDLIKLMQVGKENLDNKSYNLHFHRAQMYGQIIVMKLVKEFGKNFQYSLGMIEMKSNSKIRWFEIQVFIKLPKQLQEAN